jgi:hypothetical protein
MGHDLRNGIAILAYLILGTVIIVFLGHWALKKFRPPKK